MRQFLQSALKDESSPGFFGIQEPYRNNQGEWKWRPLTTAIGDKALVILSYALGSVSPIRLILITYYLSSLQLSVFYLYLRGLRYAPKLGEAHVLSCSTGDGLGIAKKHLRMVEERNSSDRPWAHTAGPPRPAGRSDCPLGRTWIFALISRLVFLPDQPSLRVQ